MKTSTLFAVILLLVITGCGGNRQTGNDSIITVDVRAHYPQKELILQDFMDVEYVALETNDEFVCQGEVLAVGKHVIIVKNRLNDGDIFIFDRNGKGLRKFNRKGQGGEEYTSLPAAIILDEDNDELFINTHRSILVYDLYGKFKRKLLPREGATYTTIQNFDKENLICSDNNSYDSEEEIVKSPFVIISKLDGSIAKEIPIFCQQKFPSMHKYRKNDVVLTAYGRKFPDLSIIPCNDSWILTVYSNDTVFSYLPDHSLTPVMVRTPSIESNNPEAFLYPVMLTDRYYFMTTEKIEPEIEGTTMVDIRIRYPSTNLIYVNQEKSIYEYTVYNNDYSSKKTVGITLKPGNNEIAFWRKIESYELVESFTKGELKGQLKDIAAVLDVEDNPVIMLVKYKKQAF